jgi:hypothetical protein
MEVHSEEEVAWLLAVMAVKSTSMYVRYAKHEHRIHSTERPNDQMVPIRTESYRFPAEDRKPNCSHLVHKSATEGC